MDEEKGWVLMDRVYSVKTSLEKVMMKVLVPLQNANLTKSLYLTVHARDALYITFPLMIRDRANYRNVQMDGRFLRRENALNARNIAEV